MVATRFYEALLLMITLFSIGIGIFLLGSVLCCYYDECFNFPTADQKILLRTLDDNQKETNKDRETSETEF